MRVAVHFPDGAVAAFRLGRIEEGVHNAPVGHDPVPLEDFLARLVQQAQAEFPECQVVLERLVHSDVDGESEWIPADEFDPAEHSPVGAGVTQGAEIAAAPVATTEGAQ
jgi:hypothetical protein